MRNPESLSSSMPSLRQWYACIFCTNSHTQCHNYMHARTHTNTLVNILACMHAYMRGIPKARAAQCNSLRLWHACVKAYAHNLLTNFSMQTPGSRKIEIFARNHNIRPGWLSLGNQLGEYYDWTHDMISCDNCHRPIDSGNTRYGL